MALSDTSRFGFSSGALCKGDFRTAIQWLHEAEVDVIELSALRFSELAPLVRALTEDLELCFKSVSIHAPSSFTRDEEDEVIELLSREAINTFAIVIHPDVLHTPSKWRQFGRRLLVENMDDRKTTGRTADELDIVFKELPEAGLCFDIGHARQVDPSLLEAWRILEQHGDRLAEIHVSHVDEDGAHAPMEQMARNTCRWFQRRNQADVPVVIESPVGQDEIEHELGVVQEALSGA